MDSSRIDGVTRTQLLALLRAGLWGTEVDATLFAPQDTDWRTLYEVAAAQAVIGIVYDGIITLPPHLQPPRPLYMQWCAAVARIEDANALLDRVMCEVIALYEAEGICPVILKGQGVARYYRNPHRRQCGDIDIYVSPENYRKANEILLFNGATRTGEESHKHAAFQYHGAHIENHRLIGMLNSPIANRRFQREIIQWYEEGEEPLRIPDPQAPGRECIILTPPDEFNYVYLLQHALTHFLNSGIGLRHVCDWARFVYVLHERPDLYFLYAMNFQYFGLMRAAWAFAHVAVTHLGLPANRVDINFDQRNNPVLGEKLMDDIWQTGNFGQHDSRIAPRPAGYWTGKWYTFTRATRRCSELRQFAPAEARWYAVTLVRGTLTIQWNRLKQHLRS